MALVSRSKVKPMLARNKPRSEFERVALPHLDSLFGVAYRLTRNPRDAEDLVQDAILRAYRFWDTFQRDSNCKAWLLKILTNTFLNDYQKRKRDREVLAAASAEQQALDGVLVHEGAAAQRDPEGLILERMLSDDVAEALASLPTDFRIAVILCDLEGLSYKEIAEVMGCPVGTVMSRLFRGRSLLRKALTDYAIAQGIIKPEGEGRPEGPGKDERRSDNMIDLNAYRRGRDD